MMLRPQVEDRRECRLSCVGRRRVGCNWTNKRVVYGLSKTIVVWWISILVEVAQLTVGYGPKQACRVSRGDTAVQMVGNGEVGDGGLSRSGYAPVDKRVRLKESVRVETRAV